MDIYGESHQSIIKPYCNLGTNYYELGVYDKASEYLDKAINISKISLGENHFFTKQIANNIKIIKSKIENGENTNQLSKKKKGFFRQLFD